MIFDCPPGCVAVYSKHFDFGLRPPLHPFIIWVLRAWNVYLAQVSPIVICNLVAFAWLCSFKQWPLTLNLFKELQWFKKNGRTSGWYTIITKPQRMTVFPKLSSCKDGKDRIYWLKVSSEFPLRRAFYRVRPRMEHLEKSPLSARETRAFDHVLCEYIYAGLSKLQMVPAYLLSNTHYILSNPAWFSRS